MHHAVDETLPQDGAACARPLSFMDKLGYGCGDLSSNLLWGMLLSFLMYYYTDIYVIPAAAVAWLLLVPRVVDAFCDPLFGYLIDRSGGRHVTRLLGGLAIPFGIAAFLCFLPLPLSPAGKIGWACFSYLLFGVIYSAINIPYGVLSNMMATRAQERVSLNGFRLGGCQLGQLIVSGLTLPAIAYLGGGTDTASQQSGISILVAMIGAVCAVLWLVVWRSCKVRRMLPFEKHSLKALLGALVSNRRWHLANALTFLNFMVFCTQGGMAIHYTRFVLGKPAEYASFVLTAPLAAAFIGAISVSRLTARFGIRRTYLFLMVWEVICQAIVYASGSHFTAVVAAMMVQYLAVGAVSPLCFSILSEAIDKRRAETGVAAAGLAFSINALVGKVSAGCAGFAIATFLAWGHYHPGLELANPELTTWLKAGFIGLPTLSVVLAFLIAFPSAHDHPHAVAPAGLEPQPR